MLQIYPLFLCKSEKISAINNGRPPDFYHLYNTQFPNRPQVLLIKAQNRAPVTATFQPRYEQGMGVGGGGGTGGTTIKKGGYAQRLPFLFLLLFMSLFVLFYFITSFSEVNRARSWLTRNLE